MARRCQKAAGRAACALPCYPRRASRIFSAEEALMPNDVLLIDHPRPGVRRLTMNRPEKRNALNNELRGAILAALQDADATADVKVSILRGAGPAFSAGYDLGANNAVDQPYYTAGGAGQWARHVVEGW